ncbi:MAG: hypothetical protein WD673_03035 [Alphaproteobacteria bacterium]
MEDRTIVLDQGSVVDSQPDHLVLSGDAVGTIVLVDGSELTFQGVEVVQW